MRALRSLLSAEGVDRDSIVVSIDGGGHEPTEVARALGIRTMATVRAHDAHQQIGGNGRICNHYKASITRIFRQFPMASHVLVRHQWLSPAHSRALASDSVMVTYLWHEFAPLSRTFRCAFLLFLTTATVDRLKSCGRGY